MFGNKKNRGSISREENILSTLWKINSHLCDKLFNQEFRFNLFGEQMRNFREKRTAKILRTMGKCREKKLNQSK